MARQGEMRFPAEFFGMEELGRLIKKVRLLRGWTQQELAMRTNTSTKFISNVENGKETAQSGRVFLLVRVLDLGTQLVDLQKKGSAE
jgi:transcriptional regulator with XRE-family HTH domain